MSKPEFTSIRWPKGSKRAILAIAKRMGMKPSEFIRYTVLAAISKGEKK